MDEEQIKALIAASTQPLLDTITTLEATVTKLSKAPKAPKAPGSPEPKSTEPEDSNPLASTVKQLEQKLANMEAQRERSEYLSELDGLLDGFEHRARGLSKKALLAEIPKATRTDAGYVLEDGSLLKAKVTEYFGSEEGKVLLKSKRSASGPPEDSNRVSGDSPATNGLADLAGLAF
jgi:hypothetical protein